MFRPILALATLIMLPGCALKAKIMSDDVIVDQNDDGTEEFSTSAKTCAVHISPELLLSAGLVSVVPGANIMAIMALYTSGRYAVCLDDRMTRGVNVDIAAARNEVKQAIAKDLQSSFNGAKTAIENKRVDVEKALEAARATVRKEAIEQAGTVKAAGMRAIGEIDKHVDTFRHTEFEIYERPVQVP